MQIVKTIFLLAILLVFSLCASLSAQSQTGFVKPHSLNCAIAQSDNHTVHVVQDYMWRYPQSQLRDLYKFCFQDVFGLEHLLNDSLSAVRYIEYEMANSDSNDWRQPLFVYPLTLVNNYVRVDINYVRKGVVPMGVFVSAMLRSVENNVEARRIDKQSWPACWHSLLEVIERVTPRPLNFEEDKALIDEVLKKGEYAVHHSALFNATYHQHYRIIRRDVFEQLLAPLIQQSNNTHTP